MSLSKFMCIMCVRESERERKRGEGECKLTAAVTQNSKNDIRTRFGEQRKTK